MYSLDDLDAAKAELKRWDDAYINNSSNNPNKYEAERRDARRRAREISAKLKLLGLIEMSDAEKVTNELDQLYPNSKSKTIVIHNGIKYQIRYFPVEKSRSDKTVKEWAHEWVPI